MESAEIRRRFLAFFAERGHTVVESAPLVHEDPTLLFVNAGMVPFKPYFLGQQTPAFNRATSVQKVVRTVDIDEVGKTTRHASFFQMCGNFSFGDYFKSEAIPFAWELLTTPVSEGGYGLDPGRLWATVYQDDEEAERIWVQDVGLPAERVQRRGMADNFWSMGVPGPCGPCSEIYYDRGPEHGAEGGPIADEDRYLEVWNLVFMQFERGEGPAKEGYELLGDLPARNIDTGLGLERLAALLQGVDNIYEIDTTRVVIDRAAELAGATYGADDTNDVRLRVVADHIRTAVMLVGDGVVPGNEGRGYVLRRMVRRVIRSIRLVGAGEQPTVAVLAGATIDAMAPQYPELEAERDRIVGILTAEEEAFLATLRNGTQMFDQAVRDTKGSGASALSGSTAFRLHDTYGFPIDLTVEMAQEAGLAVDEDGFRALMSQQRERAQADARAKKAGHVDTSVYREVADAVGQDVEFTGYQEIASDASVRGLILDGRSVSAAPAGTAVDIVLDRTPFYAEAGGQLADHGVVELAGGARLRVDDVQKPLDGLVVHRATVLAGEAVVGEAARGAVDIERRKAISRAHTATHMVHKAFREALGDTAAQAGSENAPGRFRFDFAAAAAVPASVLVDVQDRVNALVGDDLDVHAEIMDIDEARRSGAMALFGEKYGREVRVISVGDWARELCGGTHAQRSGQLGLVTLLGESSVGQGVRRVEALVGIDAFRFMAREHVLVSQLTSSLKVRPEELPERVHTLLERLKHAEREIEQARARAVLATAADAAAAARDVGGVRTVLQDLPGETSADDVRRFVLDVRQRLADSEPAVVAAFGQTSARPVVVVATTAGARDRGISANDLVRQAAKILGGGGGGKPDVAQGGGQDPGRIPEAMAAIDQALRAGG